MWIEAIVMPREEPTPPRRLARGRGLVHTDGGAENRRFHDSLMDFLRAHELLGAVKWVSEPGTLPTVTLHCTPVVLEQLRRAPQFEAGRAMGLELHT
jgi:hypothetical protein